MKKGKLPAPSEAEIQKQILQYLALRGIFAWRQNCGAFVTSDNKTGKKRFVRFGIPGISDIIGCLPDGRFLAIEVKSPKGKLTKYQKSFLEKIRQSGGVAIVARSLEDVEKVL